MTPEEREIMVQELARLGYVWNEEEKELEKIQEEFKPFEKVLVRDKDTSPWQAELFSHKRYNPEYPFVCVGDVWVQCIRYEGNEKLLGTTDKPE